MSDWMTQCKSWCPGWRTQDTTVKRCPDCDRFANDAEAMVHILDHMMDHEKSAGTIR